ncbi:hypothetical protein BAU15_11020 [Enterococcus sp. JM4C]|uniref:hypothetical protein n=1 Tax=Candidatus Enterococcus huntleyi TaxID=1857217 RepID=UPI00137B1785|nr:hypothetical protein [Enterococcus sp. JM4C]KAF1298649.1 hypothetical protein BAU15_11020 [Enterococcus sp. JM4C]
MKTIWLQRLMKWTTAFQKFMRGRYGRFDQLNKTLFVLVLICLVLTPWLPFQLGRILAVIGLILLYGRFFSKKIYPRSNENQAYIRRVAKVKGFFTKRKQTISDKRTYVFFACPHCQQKMRAPRGKGRIRVTCSNCHEHFEQKV